MTHDRIVCVALAVTATALAGSRGPYHSEIVTRKDVPLQTTWVLPKKPPTVKSHEGMLHADTFSWACYPAMGASFDRQRRWLSLQVEVDGPGYWDWESVVFAVDGGVHQLPIKSRQVVSGHTLGMNRFLKLTLEGQEDLMSQIGSAQEVWLTVLGSNGIRHSVRLSEEQTHLIREVSKRYTERIPPFD